MAYYSQLEEIDEDGLVQEVSLKFQSTPQTDCQSILVNKEFQKSFVGYPLSNQYRIVAQLPVKYHPHKITTYVAENLYLLNDCYPCITDYNYQVDFTAESKVTEVLDLKDLDKFFQGASLAAKPHVQKLQDSWSWRTVFIMQLYCLPIIITSMFIIGYLMYDFSWFQLFL